MLDPVVGGGSERATVAPGDCNCDGFPEFISIFQNGRGEVAQSPLPPGIFGYRDGEQGQPGHTNG